MCHQPPLVVNLVAALVLWWQGVIVAKGLLSGVTSWCLLPGGQ